MAHGNIVSLSVGFDYKDQLIIVPIKLSDVKSVRLVWDHGVDNMVPADLPKIEAPSKIIEGEIVST